MTRTELELAFDAKEDELNCCEAVLDGFVAELPEGSVETSFDCMGDYITAVVEGFKKQRDERENDAQQLREQLQAAKLQMEKQKDEWLAWEGKRKELEQKAAAYDSMLLAKEWYRQAFEVLQPLRWHLANVCESPYRKDYVDAAKVANQVADDFFSFKKEGEL